MTDGGPGERAPVPAERAAAPATTEDLRGLRRWLIVAAAWAVAATAIAAIALVAATREDDDRDLNARTSAQIARLQERLLDRIDQVGARVDELAPAEDVSRLDGRLRRAEQASTDAGERLGELSGRLDDLESRLEALEDAPAAEADTETPP